MQEQRKQTRQNIKILNPKICEFDCILDIEKELRLPATSFKHFISLIKSKKIFVLKKLSSNKILGFVQIQGDKEESEIITLGVRTKFQNKGYGKKLINYLTKNNYKNIFLEVSSSNQKAIKFYMNLGFKNISIRKKYYKRDVNQDDALILNYKKV